MAKQGSMYSGKTVVIMGLGKSALALAKLLHSRGATVKVSEMNPKDHLMEAANDLASFAPEMETEFGRHSPAFFEGADYVVVSPSVRLDTKPLDEVKQRGTPILSDVEMVLSEVDIPVIAFAGTEGKTSSAFLARSFLEEGGKKVFYCGDQGEPLANYLLKEEQADYILIELSVYQLDNLQNIRPHIAVLTSLQPPFPERFSRVEDYSRAMVNLVKNMNDKSFLVYNFRDTNLRNVVVNCQAAKRVFRRKDPIALGAEIAQKYKGTYLNNERELVWVENGVKELYSLREFNMFGLHNKDNLMAAIIVAKLAGVSKDKIQKVIDTFPGVPHRLEFIKKKGRVRLINDSRSVNVDGLRRALESFPLDPIILIAGGRDAQADFTPLAETVKKRVKTMILVGEAKEHINRCVGDHSETFLVGTFEEAILLSYQKSREGDIILLSPGCESYDMFVSYEERGNYFRKYVEDL